MFVEKDDYGERWLAVRRRFRSAGKAEMEWRSWQVSFDTQGKTSMEKK